MFLHLVILIIICKDTKNILFRGETLLWSRILHSFILVVIILRGKLSFSSDTPMERKDELEWLKCKRYMHLDLPLEGKEVYRIISYVKNSNAVSKHAFLPLIRRTLISYPYRKDEKTGERKCKAKKRLLTYASHEDSAIFAYYAYNLQKKYESYLVQNNLSDVVTAYRKIPCEKREGNKCSIDFANDVFRCIKEKLAVEKSLAVITFDIKSFFNNLDHKLLKRNWGRILGEEQLPSDEYAVYKNVVHYSYVDDLAVFKLMKNNIVCRKKNGDKIERKVKNKAFLRDKGALAYCLKRNISQIRKNGLIKTKSKDSEPNKGIPQGLPISSVLANLYMMDFDLDVNHKLFEIGAVYRRYSDDIIVVCPKDKGEELKLWIQNKIKEVGLEIQDRKTNLYFFTREGDKIKCEHSTDGTCKKLEYLGFSFDGNSIMLKNSSVGKFYYKMHKTLFRAIHYASHMNNSTRGKIFEHRLISRFTYAGSHPHQIYKRSADGKSFYTMNGMKTYGNYLTYVSKASAIMEEPKIKRQLRRCTSKLSKSIKQAKVQVSKNLYYKALDEFMRYGRTY